MHSTSICRSPLRQVLTALSCAAVVFWTTGCASTLLRDAVNAAFPPQNPVDHQVAAVKEAAAALAEFKEAPTVYVSLAADDLRRVLPSSLAANIKAKSGQEIEIQATSVRLGFGPQQVIVHADFSVALPAEETTVKGTVDVHCAASVYRGALVLRPSGRTLRLSSLVYRGSKAADLLTPAVNALLRTFLDNINGAIAAQSVPLRFHVLRSLDLAQTLRATPGVVDATGTVVTGGLALGSSAVLIEPSAVRVLASAVFLTQEQFEKGFERLESRVKAKKTNPLSSEELAALAACQNPGELAQSIGTSDVAKVQAICDATEKELAPLKTEPFPTTSEAYNALAASYPKYHDGFMLKAQEVEPGTRVYDKVSMVAISRTAVAKGLQTILSQASASAHYQASIPEQGFNQLITPTTTNLKCSENAGGCDSDFSYPGYNPRGCDSNCMTRKCKWGICIDVPDLDCGRRKLECEATKEKERLEYEANKAAAQLKWKIEKDACELRKQINKTGCELNQAWLNAWASKEIARIEGTATVSDLRAFGAIDDIRLAPDLSSLSVDYRASASASIRANAKVTPLNGGHLICVMPANLDVSARGNVEATTKTVGASQKGAGRDGQDLLLTYEISGQQVALKFAPPLPVALYQQNREKLLLSCPAPLSIVNGLTGFAGGLVGIEVALALRPDLFDMTKTIDIPGVSLPLRIPPQDLTIPPVPGVAPSSIRLNPEWGKNALIFSGKVKN